MPQEIRVVKCYKCGVFQTDIVKKAKKWSCKICGEKQSVMQEYGRGSGKDCRLHAQQLNQNKNKDEEIGHNIFLNMLQHYEINESDIVQPKHHREVNILNRPKDAPIQQNVQSKWDQYVEKNKNSDNESDTDLLSNSQAETKPLTSTSSVKNDRKRVSSNSDQNMTPSKIKTIVNTKNYLVSFGFTKNEIKEIFDDNLEIFNEASEESSGNKSSQYKTQQKTNLNSTKSKIDSKWCKFISDDND